MEKLFFQPLKMRVLNIFNKVFNNFKVQIIVKNKLEYSIFSQKRTEYFMKFCIFFCRKNFQIRHLEILINIFTVILSIIRVEKIFKRNFKETIAINYQIW